MNLIIFGALTPVYVLCIPNARPQPDAKMLPKILSLDWVGILLNCGIYVAWIIALQFSGSTWPWSTGVALLALLSLGLWLFFSASSNTTAFLPLQKPDCFQSLSLRGGL